MTIREQYKLAWRFTRTYETFLESENACRSAGIQRATYFASLASQSWFARWRANLTYRNTLEEIRNIKC